MDHGDIILEYSYAVSLYFVVMFWLLIHIDNICDCTAT